MPKESSNRLRILSICVCALCAVGICVGTVFDFDISMALMSESYLGARIADYGLGLVDLFYAFAGTCLFVGLRQKGEHYGLLAKVALGIGMSMSIIFFANDAGWNVRAMMGYVGGESSPLLALASLIPTVVMVSAVPLVFAKRLEDKDPRQAHCDGRVSHRVRHLRPVCERPAQAALLEAAATLLGHPRRALLRVQGVVADGALCRRAQRCRGKLPVQSHDARGFDVQPTRHRRRREASLRGA